MKMKRNIHVYIHAANLRLRFLGILEMAVLKLIGLAFCH